ncbi:MAG: excinuclease ABC subunit UvrA [Patescibacteria group bacterium]|nr:excinuclease ABC subunit UvrA [Patescibacteria group bacterium]
MAQECISIRGARVHNLKNVDLDIPKGKLVVFTGISGSGKSSLAFDTIYAEGQRRYVESLSSYARQFLGVMDKPDVDRIEGLSPAIAIDQRSASGNPRSTVGTMTEVYDYLRLLYARVGVPHCPRCGGKLDQHAPAQITEALLKVAPEREQTFLVLSCLPVDNPADLRRVVAEAAKAGYQQVRLDHELMSVGLAANRPYAAGMRVEAVVAVVTVPSVSKRKAWPREDLDAAVRLGLDLGNGRITVHPYRAGAKAGPAKSTATDDLQFCQFYHCPRCHVTLPPIEPRSFSFNSPAGACGKCLGLGTRLEVDPELVMPNPRLTLAQGAIKPWARNFFNQNWYWELLGLVARRHNFTLDTPVADLSAAARQVLLRGSGEQAYALADGSSKTFPGVIALLEQKYAETSSDYLRKEISQYMRIFTCPACGGRRLRPEVLAVTVGGKNIAEVAALSVTAAETFVTAISGNGRNGNGAKGKSNNATPPFSAREMKVATLLLKEILVRLRNLRDVGLRYLTLDRAAMSLSGGEAQRIRLATQLSLQLSGVVYILDEPSVGLHQKDNAQLITTLKSLRDLGNTVIVVEHDPMMMAAADAVVDIGPGAGEYGGEIVAQGNLKQIMASRESLTGRYLCGRERITPPAKARPGCGKFLEIAGAREFNLKGITVKIPLGTFTCVTGVSGSGKSTLMLDILVRALEQRFYRAKERPGAHDKISGLEHVDKVISIDQSPIGRTPRSNPATYTGLFTYIRDLYAETPEAKIRGYDVGKFSFNARGGRCEHCAGDGAVQVEMQFLPDVYLPCEYCRGRRYKTEVLDIHCDGKNIADVLEMSVDEAYLFFRRQPAIREKLETLRDVGLGYLKLGQPATTLSGGEAQRVKLATELSRRATGRTLYILDEPTTGLHFEDIKRLLSILDQLVAKGNTVLVIEHNLDVIKCADWVIDLGPEGGDAGGQIVAVGTPGQVAKVKGSFTGQYLKDVLAREPAKRGVQNGKI